MDLKDIHSRMQEFSSIRENAGNDEAALLEVTLFVEDVFEITLSDDEICEENLGTHEDTEAFVQKKLKA